MCHAASVMKAQTKELKLSLHLVSSDNNYTVLPSGLQQDMPPAIGSLSVKKIIIDKNDNAEGVLEFPPEALNFIGNVLVIGILIF